ncbi:MAG: malate/lactate/ureidoglycolate dehydrogenase [Desulfuromonadaceae bacterium]|nr:malate/lactate/ureidoglycolate dehydrogenase [Desulfuromonadaceae bacterium]
MLISEQKLKKVLHEILQQAGSDEYEAALVSEHLVRANLTGHDSHGAIMLPIYIRNMRAGLLVPGMCAKMVKDDDSIMIFDGQRGYGQRVAAEAMDAAINRCRETGVVLMTLRNAHHIGRVGAYGEQSIAAGLVSLHFVNVIDHPPLVAPFGGRDARFSTNPICIAMPATGETPAVLLDMATSRIARGKAMVAMNKGERMAEGLILDSEGEPTTDPSVMFREPGGALLPFGEHKGYGLATLCELLAGVLTGGGTIQPENKRLGGIVNNMFTFVFDPCRLVEHEWMQHEMDAFISHVKGSPPSVPGESVMVAGEPERKKYAERSLAGIPIEEVTWEEIMRAAEDVGINRSSLELL